MVSRKTSPHDMEIYVTWLFKENISRVFPIKQATSKAIWNSKHSQTH